MDIRKKKQKKVESGSPNSDVEDDAWIFIFIKRKSYLIVAYEIGKQGLKTCRKLFNKVLDRIQLPFPDSDTLPSTRRRHPVSLTFQRTSPQALIRTYLGLPFCTILIAALTSLSIPHIFQYAHTSVLTAD